MMTIEDFRQFFSERLAKELGAAESARKSTIFKAVLVWVLAVPLGIVATWGITKLMGAEHLIAVAILVTLVFGFVAYMFWKEVLSSRHFYNLFKGRVIDGIIRFVDERLHYIPHRYIPPATLVKSRLFALPIHQYEGDDYCFMQLENGTSLEFSEVHAKSIEKKDNKKEFVPVFDGLFAHIHCSEPRIGDLYILPKGMTEADLYQPGRLQSHTTENSEFDQNFTVYASSLAAARKYLTPQLIEALLQFRREHPERTVLLATHGKEVYVGITCKSHLFEPDVWQPLTNVSALEEFFIDVSALMRLLRAAANLSGSPVQVEAQPA
ncbi:MAG: DUF3137 domain-containing protein [Bacteroidia bacterium]|nr:DUF3137 domain-containing protein [Bacteroidia bacterium]MDW8416786.1 DUF3137 domain-containing protein [Bacteroidia bacterium]